MSKSRGIMYGAILACVVGSVFCSWTWVRGTDVAVPLIPATPFNFMIAPLQPHITFEKPQGGTLGDLVNGPGDEVPNKPKNSWMRRNLGDALDWGGKAAMGVATGSRAYMWYSAPPPNGLRDVTSYIDLKDRVCMMDWSKAIAQMAQFRGEKNDCGLVTGLMALSACSLVFLAGAAVMCILGLAKEFGGACRNCRDGVFITIGIICICLAVIFQVINGCLAVKLMYMDRSFGYYPYIGMFFGITAFVLFTILPSPCMQGKGAAEKLLEKQQDEYGAQGQQQYGTGAPAPYPGQAYGQAPGQAYGQAPGQAYGQYHQQGQAPGAGGHYY